MKRTISALLAILLIFSISACKKSPQNTSSDKTVVSKTSSATESAVSQESSVESQPEESKPEETPAVSSAVSSSEPSASAPAPSVSQAPASTVPVKPSAPAVQTKISIPEFSQETINKIASLSNERKGFSWAYPESDGVLNQYNTYTHGDLSKNTLYLTFDEGYEYNNHTSRILDILKTKQVKAVFFVTLSYVKSNPALVRRMIDEGHAVGNHTVSHPDMTAIGLERAYNEIKQLHDYMLTNFNYSMHLFRFPTGAYTYQVLELIKQMGYKTVFWSFAYQDWDTSNQPNIADSRNRVLNYVKNGTLYLLHACSSTNVAILPDLIDGARQRGFTFEVFD